MDANGETCDSARSKDVRTASSSRFVYLESSLYTARSVLVLVAVKNLDTKSDDKENNT